MHFLIGKGLSSAAGFIALILTVRSLSIPEFATYSILIALVEYVTALSGFGLTHVVLRYVPELYGHEYGYAFRTFVSRTLFLRVISLVGMAALAYLFSDKLIWLLGGQVPARVFEVFLLVASIRTGSFFLSQILDSTLSQGMSQLAFMVSAIVKVVAIAYLIYINNIGLINIILVEAVGDMLAVSIMLFGIYRVLHAKRSISVPQDDATWLKSKGRAILRYAITGYIQHLIVLPYGGHTNRLIGGNYLTSFSMASYGFAQSLYEYCKRYLPAQLLLGVIRPVIISRYASTKDFSSAVRLTESFFKVNALMVAPLLILFLVVGPEVVAVISKGKYAASASMVMVVLLVLLLLDTIRMQLEVLVQAVEKYEYLLVTNFFLSCSIIPSFFLLHYFDAWVMPACNIVGLIFSNTVVLMKLKKDGFLYSHDWSSSFRLLLSSLVALLFSISIKTIFNVHWVVICIVIATAYPLSLYFFYRAEFKSLLISLKSKSTISS